MFKTEKAPAVWTHVQDVTKNDQKLSIYLSDGGAVKITRHTDKGETRGTVIPAAALEDFIDCSGVLPDVFQAFQSIKDDIQKNKQVKREEAKVQAQVQREAAKALLRMQAEKERLKGLGLNEAQIKALLAG